MASHSSAKLSDVNLASAFSLMRHSMKKKVQEVVQQSAANLAELVMFLVLSHQNLNDPKYACELSEEILQRFDNWHNELLNSCFNFKRINYRHISDFKFNLGTSKGSDKLFAKLDKLTDMMRSPAAISEIVEEPNRLKCFLLDVVKIIDAKVSLAADGALLATFGGETHRIFGMEEPLGLRLVVDGNTLLLYVQLFLSAASGEFVLVHSRSILFSIVSQAKYLRSI